MEVVVSFRLKPKYVERIQQTGGPDVRVSVCSSQHDVLAAIPQAEVLYAGLFNKAIFQAGRSLRWVHGIGAGVEDILIPEVVQSSVVVTNARGVGAIAVPEHVLGLMLALSRRLHACAREQAAHRWGNIAPDELYGKTLSILGLGTLGVAVAQRAKALGMRVVGMRRNQSPVPQCVDALVPPSELLLLMEVADFLVITAPLTPETEGVIGEHELRRMKQSAYLINVGRGRIVREKDLVCALQGGWIAGAGLDVFESEPLPAASPLWDMENVIITPHCAGSTVQYMDRAVPIFCENLVRYRRGEPLVNVVDKARGY